MVKIPKVPKGYKRQWLKCKKCGNVAFHDYVPYSLSNPIITLPCGHLITGRLEYFVENISADEALIILTKKEKKKK